MQFITIAKEDKMKRASINARYASTTLASEYQKKLEQINHFKRILEYVRYEIYLCRTNKLNDYCSKTALWVDYHQ
jgi:hypothetical protein